MLPLRRLLLAKRPHVRTFLSPAYSCDEAWSKAKESRLLGNLRLDELYSRACSEEGPPTTVDVDLLALGAAKARSHLHELRDLLIKHRLSAKALHLPDSVSYSTIRAYAESGEPEHLKELLDVLDDRINYGIFPCAHTASMLMDRFIRDRDHDKAARVASLLMLQEDFCGPIPERLSRLAAYKYLARADLTEAAPVVEAAPATPVKKKKVEEIKIRVGYLRNPHFDDHFDIRDPLALAGKTLAALSRGETPLDANCRLIGLMFHKKFDAAIELAAETPAFADTVALIEKMANNCKNPDRAQEKERIDKVLAIVKASESRATDIEKELSQMVQEAVQKYEKQQIEHHSKLFDTWEADREKNLKEQIEKYENVKRERAIREREEALKEIEDRLWFYENEEKVELMIEGRVTRYQKRWFGSQKKPKQLHQDYVPPEIRPKPQKIK